MDHAAQKRDPGVEALAKLFEFTYNVTKQNVDGFTHEDSLTQPKLAGNCLNWVVGHIVATRNALLDVLGEPRIWTAEQSKPYDRGSGPLLDDAKARNFAEILKDLDASQEAVRAGLAKMTPEALAAPLPPDRNPFGLSNAAEMIGAFNFHEAYHAGQAGILRRILGKEGVIN